MLSRFALLSLLASLVSSTVTDCGSGKSLFTIVDQQFSPDPPVPNEKYDYWFYYQVPDGLTVDSGTTKYSLTLNGIPFTPTVDDLCTQTSCPKVPGFHNETSSDVWPSGVSGKIVTKLEWFDSTGALLLCSQTTVKTLDDFDSSSSSSSGSSNSSSSSSSGSSSSSSGSSSTSSGSSSSSSGSSSTSSGSSSTSSGSSSSSSEEETPVRSYLRKEVA